MCLYHCRYSVGGGRVPTELQVPGQDGPLSLLRQGSLVSIYPLTHAVHTYEPSIAQLRSPPNGFTVQLYSI